MARKSNKKPDVSRVTAKPSGGLFALLSNRGVKTAMAAILMFAGVVWLYPHLEFPFSDSGIDGLLAAGLSAGIVLWGLTATFHHVVRQVTIIVMVLFGLIILSNVSLHFAWVPVNPAFTFLSTWMIFPCSALLAVILSQHSHSILPDDTPSIKTVLRQRTTAVLLVLTLLAGAILIFYKLGYFNFWEDEVLVMNAAIGLRDQGWAYLETGYDRSWMHTGLVSWAIQVFGESEWSARLPSACAGILFILISFYTFHKWLGRPWIGVIVALICLLTQEFLVLFRYTRMYAILIPVFLFSMYIMYRFLTQPISRTYIPVFRWSGARFHAALGLCAISLVALGFHIHPLSAIGVLASMAMILVLWWMTRESRYRDLVLAGGLIMGLSLVLGQAEIGPFIKLKKALIRLMQPDTPEHAYFSYLFSNGLPRNLSLLTLVAGTGLLCNDYIRQKHRLVLVFFYLLVVLDLVFMVYLMSDPGRDYRYVVHVVPFVVALQCIVLYGISRLMSTPFLNPVLLGMTIAFSGLNLMQEYGKVYIRHPWAPRYTAVYPDIEKYYKTGEALMYQNIKTYYLDPDQLAGANAIKLGRRKEMTLDQFKQILDRYPAAWVIFDTHKSYHLHPDILRYLANKFRHLHGTGIDEHGIEVYYFQRR